MKNKKLIYSIAVCIIAAALGITVYLNQSTGTEETSETAANTDMDAEVKEGLTEDQEEVQLYIVNTIYNVEAQAEIKAQLQEETGSGTYTMENVYYTYNPFGSNTCSLYVYFETENPASVAYTVSVEDEDISDFTHDAYQTETYMTTHEFQVIGLIPEMENTVVFTITYEDGTSDTSSITYEMGELLGEEEVQLETTVYDTEEELEDGLYVVLGNDSTQLDFMYYYDNTGTLRGEVPIIGYRSHRLLFDEDKIYYSISETEMAVMDRLGQITAVYDLGDYQLHHDYVFDDENNLIILATDTTQNTQEDIIIYLDTETGEVTELMDLGDYFPDYKEECLANADEDDDEVDWMHINTVQWLGDGSVLLSSRETSTIIKVDNVLTDPEIDYMIGSEEFWEGTEYASLLLNQDGDFTIQGGQHSITYVEDDSLEDGQYYLYLFNNNIGISNSNPDFDWSSVGLTESSAKDGDASYY